MKEGRKVKPLGVAVVQMRAEINQIEKNLSKIEYFVNDASKQNIDIICFPELSVTGYSRQRAHEMVESIPGKSSNAISQMAEKYGITILTGVVEESGMDKPFITHLIAFPNGKIEKYRKTHLGLSEQKYFSSGDDLSVFQDEKVNFGIQICWDIHFPEVSTVLSLNGCEIIFAPHASPVSGNDRKKVWTKYLNARAYDNSVYVAACNLVGYDGERQEFGGGTLIIDPKGNIVNEYFGKEEEMITAYLEPELINEIRTKRSKSMKNSFYLTARRPELYGDLAKSINTGLEEGK